MPIVGRIATSGADVAEGVAALHAWGRVAKALADASGVVPIVLVLVGPAVSGPALLLGHRRPRDHDRRRVRLRDRPRRRRRVHRRPHRQRDQLGGAAIHERESGVATARGRRRGRRRCSRSRRCSRYLPVEPSRRPPVDGHRRPGRPPCARAASAVPARATASYDVRTVIDDVLDEHSFLELRARVRAQHGHRARAPRRATGRHRRQPADAPGRHPRHRGVAQGGALRAVVRRVQLPARHLRRHARLRAGQRPRVARHDPPRRRAGARVRRGDRAALCAWCCARRTAARTS